MSEHPNATAVRSGFAAFATGDMAALDALFDDAAVWHNGGRNMLTGDYRGKEEIFGFFARAMQSTDSMEQELHAVLADDTHAVALVKVTATRGGKTLHTSNVFTFHVADGTVKECWVTAGDQYAADEFWTN